MKRLRRTHIVFLLMAVLCLCGCQKEQPVPETTGSTPDAQEENPFDTEEIEKSGQTVQANFSFGVHNFDENKSEISYDGGELQVDFEIVPEQCSFECAVLIYIDGMLQPYALEPGGRADGQHTVKVDNQATIISTYFTPQVEADREKHYIHFLCMFDPESKPEEGKISLGNSHKITQILPWKFIVKGTAKEAKNKIVKGKTKAIPKKKDGAVQYEIENGKKDGEITFRVWGGLSASYRLSAYIGHKLATFGNGASYMDVTLDETHMYEGNLSLDAVTAEEYDTLYFVAVPIRDVSTAMVEKSTSFCLHHGEVPDDTN